MKLIVDTERFRSEFSETVELEALCECGNRHRFDMYQPSWNECRDLCVITLQCPYCGTCSSIHLVVK